MNHNYALSITLLSVLASASLNADYMSIQNRQNALMNNHTAIMKKWQPALNNLSPDSLKAIMKKVKGVLKAKETNPLFKSEEHETKALIRDLESWPFMFACEELDRDIQTLSARIDEARMFNMDYEIDMSPLQNLRVQMDTMPCLLDQVQRHASFVKSYAAFMAGLGIACTSYVWSSSWTFKP